MSHLIILPILLPLLTGLLLLLVPESRRMLGHVLSLISTGLLTLVTRNYCLPPTPANWWFMPWATGHRRSVSC